MRPHVFWMFGDPHWGSTLAGLPPSGIQIRDGVSATPGPIQRDMWARMIQHRDDIRRYTEPWRQDGAKVHLMVMGDVVDGDHHSTDQIIGRSEGSHIECARQGLTALLDDSIDTIHFISGTTSHVGRGAGLERAIAGSMRERGWPVVECPFKDAGTVWPWLYVKMPTGWRFHFAHHGRAGQREHTRKSYSAIFAYEVHGAHVNDGRESPDISFRAHNHKMVDSGPDHRGITRAIGNGCWQATSDWALQKVESRPDFGGFTMVIHDEMTPHDAYDPIIKAWKYNPQASDTEAETWTP